MYAATQGASVEQAFQAILIGSSVCYFLGAIFQVTYGYCWLCIGYPYLSLLFLLCPLTALSPPSLPLNPLLSPSPDPVYGVPNQRSGAAVYGQLLSVHRLLPRPHRSVGMQNSLVLHTPP
jgi:hypothetical protein